MSFELRINDEAFEVERVDDLREGLARVWQTQFSEVWLIPTEEWPTLAMLVNGDAAWLMFLRYEGDSGFSTRNPKYAGPATSMLEFYLSSGSATSILQPLTSAGKKQ